jgi:hypothetical protein
MEYVVAIPSYNRADILPLKTLRTLQDGCVPPDRIKIFVADEAQATLYRTSLSTDTYDEIIVGVLGLVEQRNFIGEYFPVGTHIVQMDDDVSGLYKTLGDRDTNCGLTRVLDLHVFFQTAFAECVKHSKSLWGVFPIHNAYFMRNVIDTGIRFCPGWTFGIINRRIPLLNPIPFKEDYERTLQHVVRDGGVIRFSGVCAKTAMYKAGGLNATKADRLKKNKEAVAWICASYPSLAFPRKMKDADSQGSELRLAIRSPDASIFSGRGVL